MGVISIAIGRIECHVRARCQYIYALPLWARSLGNKPTAYLTSLRQKAVLVLKTRQSCRFAATALLLMGMDSCAMFLEGTDASEKTSEHWWDVCNGTQPQSGDDQVMGPIPTSQQWKWGDPTLGDMVPQHLEFLRRLSTPELGGNTASPQKTIQKMCTGSADSGAFCIRILT